LNEQRKFLQQFEIEAQSIKTPSANVLETPVPNDDRYKTAIATYINFRKFFLEEQFKGVRKVMLTALLAQGNFDKLGALIEKDIAQVAAELIVKLVQGAGRDELKAFAMEYLNKKLDEVIKLQLSAELNEIYSMLDRGASKDEIKEWFSAKATEKIIASLK